MTVRTAPGEVEVKTIRTHIETGKPQAEDPDKLPSLWEYVESLTDADWASQGYRFVIERGRPETKAEERVYIGDFFEKLTPQEIARRWGGGDYTIWFKIPPKGQQLKYKKLLRVDGAPQSSTAGPSSSSYGREAQSNDPLMRFVDIMDRRMQAMEAKLDAATGSGASSRAVEQAVGLTGQVFSAATTAATETLRNVAGGNRAPDSIESTLNLLKTAKEIFAPAAGAAGPVSNSVKDFLEMLTAIKGAGLMGAPAAGGVAAQLAIEGIRTLPAAISEGVKGLEHWRFAEEARARQVAIMRGQNPNPIDVPARPVTTAGPPPAPPPVNSAASQAPGPAAPPLATVQVNIEAVEIGLVRILTNQAYTIEEAAYRAAALMEDLVPGMPDQVAAAGEAQILQLFQTRPILAAVPQNPRLTEFIKKFIEVVKKAPVITQQQPPNIPPA